MSIEKSEGNLPERLLATLRTFSTTSELIYNTAQMRYFQKKFFGERNDAKAKSEYLEKARHYEKEVDVLIERLWPQEKQSNLFNR